MRRILDGSPRTLSAGDYDGIRELTRTAVKTMLGFELAHVGINAGNEEEAASIAKLFSTVFGFEYKPGNSSIFTGSYVEVMKTPYLGEKGISPSAPIILPEPLPIWRSQGVAFNESSAKYDAKGRLVAIYLREEFGGFAVHLVQKK